LLHGSPPCYNPLETVITPKLFL